jgi:hypothetical protein
VDQGTDPHIIVPKRARVLRFQSSYKAKTRVNVIGSNSGGSWGIVIATRFVRHPGNAARNFTIMISEKAQTRLTKELNEAVALMARSIRST